MLSLGFEPEKMPLGRTCTRSLDISVLRFELIGVVRNVLQHRAQVLEIEKQQAIVVRDLEHHVEHAFLRVVQFEQAPEEKWTHFRHSCAHGMSLLAEHTPKNNGAAFACKTS